MPNNYQQHKSYVSFLFILISAAVLGIAIGTFYGPKLLQLINRPQSLFASSIPTAEEPYLERGSPLDKRQLAGQDQSIVDKIILHGDRSKKEIALTFDAEMTDGMRANVIAGASSYDKRITDTLINTNTKATLFLTGMWIQLYPAQAKTLASNPLFEFGSHSYADTSYNGTCFGLRQIQDTQDLEEIETTQKIFRDTFGFAPKYFRFPGGCYSSKDVDVVTKTAGLTIVHWDVAGNDGFNQNVNLVVRNIVDNAQNGSIIVLHMNGAPTSPKTADALPQIIQQLKTKGYTFVKVSELLSL